MRTLLEFVFVFVFFVSFAESQSKKVVTKVNSLPTADNSLVSNDLLLIKKLGDIDGQIYRNKNLGFEIQFPINWLVPQNDAENLAKKPRFNLDLQTPKAISQTYQAKLNSASNKVINLVTAYKTLPDDSDNVFFQVSIENLEATPNVKDAVDYFDFMLETFRILKLPKDFIFSEVRAEKLGNKQFAFLDTSSKAGKRRLYATVKTGFAVVFTISYKSESDLNTMKKILADGDFSLK
jgi:hypothetical protein